MHSAAPPAGPDALLRGLALFLFGAGVARLLAWPASSRPDTPYIVLLGLELTLPLFIVWAQARLGGRA